MDKILETRLCDLNVSLKGSYVENCLKELKKELKSKNIQVDPKVWISSDWFCPDGHTGFALPFYLLDPKLMALEKKIIGKAEGEGNDWCLMLMRHEMGHVLDNAFMLRKKKVRQEIFGLSSTPYPTKYRPKPYSKDFVRHLEDYYAQAHPDEDWAETFAVWLNPKVQWEKAYQDWPAINKLRYIASVMDEIANKPPLKNNPQAIEPLCEDKRTLRDYYNEKVKRLKINSPEANAKISSQPMVMM